MLTAILEYLNERFHPMRIKQLNVLRSQIEGGQKTCDFLVNVRQDFFDSDLRTNKWEQWLILIYLTKIKDEKLLNEVMKDIEEITRADKIMEMVCKLDTSTDNTKKILLATSEAKISCTDIKDRI